MTTIGDVHRHRLFAGSDFRFPMKNIIDVDVDDLFVDFADDAVKNEGNGSFAAR